jgi:cellulose synthase/poly-beta-1,6-N-acetylglucosamine synthase-like glycosyltransferase
LILILFIISSLINLSIYLVDLQRATSEMSQLCLSNFGISDNSLDSSFPKVSVIVPAYNETDNIQDCIMSILSSTNLASDKLEVWVVDDQSTDDTLIILNTLKEKLNDSRLKILQGLPRPAKQVWTGKNWACVQAAERAEGEFLLFIDADVRLKHRAIETVIQVAKSENVNLLNCVPALVCGSLSEWLVQPLMFINLVVSLNSARVKNPTSKTAFAFGPFMLFLRSSYEQIGGHAAVASEVAEDVALARRIKHNGLKLKYVLGANLAEIRMYRTWAALWEGWTKVLYSGSQRIWWLMVSLALVMLSIYSVPWLVLIIVVNKSILIGWKTVDVFATCLALIAILLQYNLRVIAAKAFHSSTKYWWLHGLGGLMVAVIALTSVIKTETGWGWTWRGRSLK